MEHIIPSLTCRGRLSIDIPPDLPWVMGDKSRIIQVLGNLLANAARHSPDSSTIAVWGSDGDTDVRPMRTAISAIRR